MILNQIKLVDIAYSMIEWKFIDRLNGDMKEKIVIYIA